MTERAHAPLPGIDFLDYTASYSPFSSPQEICARRQGGVTLASTPSRTHSALQYHRQRLREAMHRDCVCHQVFQSRLKLQVYSQRISLIKGYYLQSFHHRQLYETVIFRDRRALPDTNSQSKRVTKRLKTTISYPINEGPTPPSTITPPRPQRQMPHVFI